MSTTALELCRLAYVEHNLNSLTTFSNNSPHPYNLALQGLNSIIRIMNRLGSFYFMETKTALPYLVGQFSYDLNTLTNVVDPRRIERVRIEAVDHWTDLTQKSWPDFQKVYQSSSIQTTKPTVFSKYNTTLYLNAIPDQDYSIYVYHYKDMPAITSGTDLLQVPERDEDVIVECVYQWLGYKMARWDYGTAFTAIKTVVSPLLVSLKSDVGIAHQMPAAF